MSNGPKPFRRFSGGACVAGAIVLLVIIGMPFVPGPSSPAVAPYGGVHRSEVRTLAATAPTWPLSTGGDFASYLGGIGRANNASGTSVTINTTNAANLHRLWTFTAGGTIASQPVESNGLIYFGAWDGYEYALYATNGSVRWKTFLGQVYGGGQTVCGNFNLGITSTATISNGTLYVNGGTPALFALNASSGASEWNLTLGGPGSAGYYLWSSPLEYQGNLYDAISSQCDDPLVPAGLVEISEATGTPINYFNASVPNPNGSSIWSTPSVNSTSGTVFVTTGNPYVKLTSTYGNSIVALNASTLAVQASWQVPPTKTVPDSDFGGTAVLVAPPGSPAMVVAVNKNGYLYDWYQSNLTLRWSDRISNQTTITTPSYGGGLIYVYAPGTTIDGTTYNASVRAINPYTGAYVWQVGFAKHYVGYSAPLWDNGIVFLDENNQLLALNGGTGAAYKVFTWALGGLMFGSPMLARNELYVTAGTTLSAIDLPVTTTAIHVVSQGAPLGRTFTSTASGGLPPYRYNWSFGDGTFANSTSPSHAYAAIGVYTVRFTVTDVAGNVSSSVVTVRVGSAYPVSFTETGLPPGTHWGLTVGNQTLSGAGLLQASLTNGSYSYAIANVANYSARMTGTFPVVGRPAALTIRFTLVKYTFTLREAGLPGFTPWAAQIAGSNLTTVGNFLNIRLPNGTYSYYVGNVSNYSRAPAGMFIVSGSGLTSVVHFALVKYVVEFDDVGLPAGATWNVTVRSNVHATSGAKIQYGLANGTYAYRTATHRLGFTGATGNLTVVGGNVTVSIDFVATNGTARAPVHPGQLSPGGFDSGTTATGPQLAPRRQD